MDSVRTGHGSSAVVSRAVAGSERGVFTPVSVGGVRPRLVLIHGTRMSHRQWAPYAELLPRAEVVAPDLPGHGSRLGETFTTDAAVAVIADAVAGAAPGQPVVLAGHSLGGYLASVYAATHPDRLAALVLIGASADPGSRAAVVYKAFAAVLPRIGYERMGGGVDRLLRRLGTPEEQLPEHAAYATMADAWTAVMQDCRPALLSAVDCPVVLVNGQYDQMRIGVRQFRAHCRRCEEVTVPRATHLLPLTHPVELAGVLGRAVDAVADESVS